MRIDSKLFVAPVSSQTTEKPVAKGSGRVPSQASVVSLSSAGAAVIADSEDVPSPRVAALKAAVEAGTYEVDLDALASRIVDDEVVRGTRHD